MRGFLRFVTRSRYHAIGISALSLLMPPFSFVGGAIIGLATLRYGATEGGVVLAGSAAVFAVAMWALAGSTTPAMVFVVVTGLPVLALSALLRTTASQGVVLVTATLVTGAAIAMLYLAVPDPAEWWLDVFAAFLTGGAEGVDPRGFEQLAEVLRAVVTGLPIAVMVTAVCTVILARWAHAALDNPGGFGREFRDLRVGRRFAFGAGAVVILALFLAPRGAGVGHDLLDAGRGGVRDSGRCHGARARGSARPRSRLARRHVPEPAPGDAGRGAGALGGGILGRMARLSDPIRSFAVNSARSRGSANQDEV